MKILVTGGTGYIGSHTCVQLVEAGYDIVIVDNLSNSNRKVLDRIKSITGKDVKFYEVNLLDKVELDSVFAKHQPDAVIHFAGLKAVGESVQMPLHYYHNNMTGTLVLCEVMEKHNVRKMVFSSSATVYGTPESVPITEESPIRATNPYGRSKLMIEEILRDLYVSNNKWSISILRYFNPIGAHESGLIGENPNGIPNNLMPYITQVAIGKLDYLKVFGDNYPTVDGTGVRDYIHVVDLSEGHLKSLEKLLYETGVFTYNLGTGSGYSVLQLVKAFEEVSGKKVPYKIVARRPGDIATCYADVTKAKYELGWTSQRGITEMCLDAWRWQHYNPNGY
ncbi:UDP-glucose 4-epimerase GalE [Bacillus sp. Marseille-P3661]|uniref:UDP-glucose 4-epimerase GalE n=1 Tax=Bacillus sp. Marseille-P3661 TaxID=1936234 RepID=UPI000C81EB31|nr:UDP-glucose 4-epimerase GalE [Bacillus sp. Marseille-P3661]